MTRSLTEQPWPADVPDVRIRSFAGPEDIAAWLYLRERTFAKQKLGVRSWTHAEFEAEFLAKPWWSPNSFWLAEREGTSELIGSVTLALRGAPPEGKPVVHWLMVRPDCRRRGIGRALVATLEAAVWELGQRQIWLETHAGWEEATAMYQALGYVDARRAI